MKEERDLGPIYGFQWRHFMSLSGFDTDMPARHRSTQTRSG